MKTIYQPSESDMAWARNLVRMWQDGGTWCCPATLLIYKHDKPGKRIVLTFGDLKDGDSAEVHERNCIVFGRIGYKVEVQKAVEG